MLRIFKGQRFTNSHPQEIAVFGKTLYYLLTTVLGARTLGEEYVDLVYVSRLGKRFPKLLPRLLYTFGFITAPYLITKLVRKLKRNEEDAGGWVSDLLTSYPNLLDTIMNIHIALFYFEGKFYSISERLFGLRYVFGHNKDPEKLKKTGNYTILGSIILVQFLVKFLIKVNEYSSSREEKRTGEKRVEDGVAEFHDVEQFQEMNEVVDRDSRLAKKVVTDLLDPKQLPYLPERSRGCMLCLSPMVNPSAANCGHMFCWDCIVDWVREHPECPLCRQVCLEQNLLPLR